MRRIELPEKPSEVLKAALHDFSLIRKRIERGDGTYSIHMGRIHDPVNLVGGGRTCEICLAGAVIVERAAPEPTQDVDMCDVTSGDRKLSDKLWFISDVATGCLMSDVHRWEPEGVGRDGCLYWDQTGPDFVRYLEDPLAWRLWVEGVIMFFEAKGM